MFAVRMAEPQTVPSPSPPATLQMGKAMGKKQAPLLAALWAVKCIVFNKIEKATDILI